MLADTTTVSYTHTVGSAYKQLHGIIQQQRKTSAKFWSKNHPTPKNLLIEITRAKRAQELPE
jgi:hypothetical protein